MALAYTAPTWEDGSGTGISASQLQAICNCIEGLVQGTDKAVHAISMTGAVITLTFADGTQETVQTSGLKGIVSIAKTGTSGLIDTYTITFTDGTTSTFTVTNGDDGAPGTTPVITVTATADAQSLDNPTVTVTKSGTDAAPSFAMAFSGLKGKQGDQGDTGAAGADGYSPEVTITSITGGHSVTITDADHPTGQTFNVMDGITQDISGKMNTSGNNAASEVKFNGAFTVGTRASGSTVGTSSVAEGSDTTASGAYSHAEGNGTIAKGQSSHAGGDSVTAYLRNCFAHGNYNSSYKKFRGTTMTPNGACFGFGMNNDEYSADASVPSNGKNGHNGTIINVATVSISIERLGMYLLFVSAYTIADKSFYGSGAYLITGDHYAGTSYTPHNLVLAETTNVPAVITMSGGNKVSIQNTTADRAVQYQLIRIN